MGVKRLMRCNADLRNALDKVVLACDKQILPDPGG
jgi:hypothetical protein